MSATLSYEPDRIPAGLLALSVHCVFFSLLYFGFTWQTQRVETMSVELWQSLPEEKVAPPVVPKIEEAVPVQPVMRPMREVEAVRPEKLVKPDIVLVVEKDKKKVEVMPVVVKPDKPKPVPSIVEEVKTKPALSNPVEQQQSEADEQAAQTARDKATKSAAIDAMVDEYKAKIINKIRRNIVKPPDVSDNAQAEFSVTLLPDGSVLDRVLKNSSGNTAYDNAVERAILKSQPLPLPPDVAMFKKFRDLNLKFRPVE
ncbi:MAG: cell envelope integrity protein TolA [Gallionella sp.]